MFLQRNTASQVFTLPGSLRSVADGSAVTSGASLTWVKDGVESAAAGTLTHLRDGIYTYAPTQGETDAKICGWTVTKSGAVGLSGSVRTTAADPNAGTNLGLSALPTASPAAANGLPILGTNAAGLVLQPASGPALTLSSTNSAGLEVVGGAWGVLVLANTGTGIAVQGSSGAGLSLLGTTADIVLGNSAAPTLGAAVADKLLGRTVTGGADGGRTVAYFLQGGINKHTRSSTTLTIYSTDDTTVFVTIPLTQDGTLQPIASADPP